MKDKIQPPVLLSVFRESFIGGIAVHSSNLYNKLREQGIDAVKVDYGPVFKAQKAGNPLALFGAFCSLLFKTLGLRLRGYKFFHFHSSNTALPYLLLCIPLYLTGCKLLLSLHSGYGFDKWLNKHPFYAKIDGILFRLLDKLIFMNQEESVAVATRYPHLANRIVTINPYIAPQESEIPKKTDFPPNEIFTVATIGAWGKRYNVQEAVKGALLFSRKNNIPVQVTVIQSTSLTEPEYVERTKAEFAEYEKDIHITLIEDTPHILEILARSDVFIRSSLGDSYGLCVAESLLVGTPAIVTDICRRCNASKLYNPGDYNKMIAYLEEIYQNRPEKRENVRLLEKEEDAFNNYLDLYQTVGYKKK